MNTPEILEELKYLGNDSTKSIFLKHGAREPFYGVKVEDLKKIQKRIKKDYQLALELYNSGISDAMYLAGLIADETQMTTDDLNHWADKAYWYMLSEYTVAWVAAESRYGWELGLKWIESGRENISSAGWSTISSFLAITPEQNIDTNALRSLLSRVCSEIENSPNRVRYTMNGFIISAGGYSEELKNDAIEAAHKIGKISVDMGDTACKVPDACTYILKMNERGAKRRKTARC